MKSLEKYLQKNRLTSYSIEHYILPATKACLDEVREKRPSFVSYDDWNIFIDELLRFLTDESLEEKNETSD